MHQCINFVLVIFVVVDVVVVDVDVVVIVVESMLKVWLKSDQ